MTVVYPADRLGSNESSLFNFEHLTCVDAIRPQVGLLPPKNIVQLLIPAMRTPTMLTTCKTS